MSALKLHTLKQKLWAIVAASFVARAITYFALPNTPSNLAPDEGTYAMVAEMLFRGTLETESDFFKHVYQISKALILPAQPLILMGFNGLDAVRLVSTVYGFLSLVICTLILFRIFPKLVSNATVYNERLTIAIFGIFAFLPSHFMWSSLALRESSTEFFLILTFIAFFQLFHVNTGITIPGFLLLFTAILLTFYARPQVGWVLSASLILFLLLNLKNVKTYFLIPLVICAAIIGSTVPIAGMSATAVTQNSPSNLVQGFKPLTNAGEIISTKHTLNQYDAASAIETQVCPLQEPPFESLFGERLQTYLCIVWRAPYMTATFFFRPIIGIDVTSTASLFAALENIFWIFLFASLLWIVLKRRTPLVLGPVFPALVFFTLYALSASAYQGNMGTGFRHKSLILWVILLMFFVFAWRKTERLKLNRGNNSQESAV
jgi:hypothetical protein